MLSYVMLLGRWTTRTRWNTLGGGVTTTRPHARSLTRIRVFLPVALILFVTAYLAAVVIQAIELIR